MTITLNHTIVPAHDKRAAAQFFARMFGLHADSKSGHFAPVRINDMLTLLFDNYEKFESHHYAFHVSDAEFDAILGRIREAKLTYGSAPWSLDDGKLNDWNGGRGVYFRDPDVAVGTSAATCTVGLGFGPRQRARQSPSGMMNLSIRRSTLDLPNRQTLCQALEDRGAGRVVPDQGRRWPHPRQRLFRGRADAPELLQALVQGRRPADGPANPTPARAGPMR